MQHRITEQSFYKYLKCPSWLIREAREGDLREVLMEKLQDDGLLREHELELLKDREVEEVDLDDLDEAALRTLELMRAGAETIYKGVLIEGHWVGRPDILEKVEGDSALGEWYYVACDIKRSRHLKDEYKFQGCFYAEILAKVQGMKPVQGYVMHADGKIDGYMIEEFESQFYLTLDSIEEILDGHQEAHFLTSGCKQTPWFSECKTETKECEDLSLINRIWRREMHSLEDAGIDTVSKLADASVSDLQKVKDLSMDRSYFLQQQAISLVEDRVIRMGEIDLPEENEVALVIDIESDPLRDADYLFGVLVVDGDTQTYHPFLAKEPSKEGENWTAFVNFLEDYEGANIYHYGWYEEEVFRRMGEKYGVSDKVKNMFEENMIDVLMRMRERVIFPMSFYSLKDLAKYIGFKWTREDASGPASVLWYEDWLRTGNEEALNDVVKYNEDDVRATWLVRTWARENSL